MARRSPAQLAVLAIVANGNVKVYRAGSKNPRVIDHTTGARINLNTHRALQSAGLVERDRSTSLYQGQAVNLTDAGRAELDAAR
ncbi:hypothetical protein ACGF3G_00670 [Streptomyces sp. NPDC048179]|uniref:hypothetical protein n=1 Tax=Streptomyces sp. NPDC048179 TaxID=3365506 RepID=UPI0037225485